MKSKCTAVKRPAAALSRAGSMKKPRKRVRPASHSGKSNATNFVGPVRGNQAVALK